MTNLEKARSIISDPLKWTQFCYARTAQGKRCSAFLEHAVKYDAAGAAVLAGVTDEEYHFLTEAAKLILAMIPDWKNRYTPDWPQVINDDLGHEYVLKMFDIAIELSKEKNI
jgi:hypothetical protein